MRTSSRIFLAVVLMLFSQPVWAGDFKIGWDAYSATDYATALREWQDLADAGDTNASYGMGLLYGNGFGVDMNDELALKYYSVAAEQGHAEAQYSLGIMHQNGWGVPINEEEGLKWYLLAAEQGIVGAQMALGRFYAMDFAETFDPVMAFKWFTIASKLGDFDAKSKADFVASRMTSEQIFEAEGHVSVWTAAHESLLVSQ